MRAYKMLPMHMQQGVPLTCISQPERSKVLSLALARRMAMTSACAVGSLVARRSAPSGRGAVAQSLDGCCEKIERGGTKCIHVRQAVSTAGFQRDGTLARADDGNAGVAGRVALAGSG